MKLLGSPAEELSVLLVDDDEMARLNRRHRGEDRPTDVLAFPMREGEFSDLSAGLLGDVVISVETARRRVRPDPPPGEGGPQPAVRKGDPLGKEVLELLIHGTLHLMGHAHQTPGQARRMRAEEGRLIGPLWPEDPDPPGAKGDRLKNLWAPWRMAYVKEHDSEDGCFLCCNLAEESQDAENYILTRSALAFVIMNLFPYSNGHLMVSPRRHTGDFTALTEAESAELTRLTQECIRVLGGTLKPHGYNVGLNLGEAAGAGVADHLHIHIVPRWTSDTNFMPVLADVKLIPDHLTNTYRMLKESFEKAAE